MELEIFHVTDPYYSVPLRAYNNVCLSCLMTTHKTIVGQSGRQCGGSEHMFDNCPISFTTNCHRSLCHATMSVVVTLLVSTHVNVLVAIILQHSTLYTYVDVPKEVEV